MATLKIEGLRASVAGKEILKGIDLTVSSGEGGLIINGVKAEAA